MSNIIIPGPNVFRAISGSLFSTAGNWSRGYVPTGSDVAMIADNCVIDINRTIGSLVVQPGFTASVSGAITLQINNVINVLGHLSCSGAPNVYIKGSKNSINSISPASSNFYYSASVNQSIPGVTYYNLSVINSYIGNNIANLTSNLIVSGNLNVNYPFNTALGGNFQLNNFDLSVLGTSYVNSVAGGLKKKNPGSILFVGNVNIGGASTTSTADFSEGNPNVECRGGITVGNNGGVVNLYAGSRNTWTFTTNNQTINPAAGFCVARFYNVNISSSLILTIASSTVVQIDGLLNGLSSNSVITGSGTLRLNTPLYPMQTGSFIMNSVGATVEYTYNGDSTVWNYPYYNLTIGSTTTTNSGIKTPVSNLYISGNLLINGNSSTLDVSSNNLVVTGSTTINAGGYLAKSKSGNIIFIGAVNTGNTRGGSGAAIDFTGGNPTVEVRNGWNRSNGLAAAFLMGTGSWYFTTNNQVFSDNGVGIATFTSPVIISGSISMSLQGNQSIVLTTGYINGTEAGSKFVNKFSTLYFSTSASLNNFMLTGSYDFTSSANNVVIGGDYTATIPSKYSSSFYNLFISGQGTKSLAVDTYVSGNLRLETPAFNQGGMLDVSSSNLIVSGTTNTGIGVGVLRKSGPGKITFIGKATFVPTSIDFTTGNPTFEFQNGIQSVSSGGDLNFGSGTCSFTTNTQIIDITTYGDQRATFKNILVSGSIVVTASSATYGWAYIYVTEGINGTTANSVFTSRTTAGTAPTIWYSGSQQPMITGILEVSSSANIFIYASGSQNVKGGTYYNLTFLNGLKTLQGNVSVLGTFSTGSGTTVGTINLNGFTLTNP
jgi:hypothetical protein